MTKIQQLRQHHGVKQYEFADKCSLGLTTIQAVEKGRRVRTSTAKLIADVLGMPISELFIVGISPKYLYPIHTFTIGETIDSPI